VRTGIKIALKLSAAVSADRGKSSRNFINGQQFSAALRKSIKIQPNLDGAGEGVNLRQVVKESLLHLIL
jgi:hypothetical protein